ncbi:MAG TPA: hypothetical protein DEB23_06155 [Chitinophagaceae bacterium]|jgi:hypothetical protein|nr:hypothetical protein [Chitinophagaceae bacterium]
MRKFVTYLGLIIVVLFTACNKSIVYELDYAYNKRLITSEVRDKFVGNWSRSITLQMPDLVFNAKDSINPGVIKFADTIIIRTIKDPNDKNGLAYLDSLNIIYPKSPGNMGDLDSAHVHISDTLTYTYAPLLINVNYNPYDSTIKNAVLEFEGQGKRNAKFNTGLILESGNLTIKNKASIYIGFWNSYLTRF